MMRTFAVLSLLLFLVGCGGSGGSYTARALAEVRAGNVADDKRPTAKEIAAVEKRIKNYPAGTVKDLHQGLWVLSNGREHEEYHFDTIVTSLYLRSAYTRVFGNPDSLQTAAKPNTWSHQCSDGRVKLMGNWVVDGSKNLVSVYPLKQNQPKKK